MAVDTYSYGTVAGVHDKCGWVIPGRAAFGSGTIPTDTEVENILDTVCSQIHAKLAESGYPVSTKTVVTADAPRVSKWLERLNEMGAAAEILMTFAIAGDPESGANYPASYWKKQFLDGLEMIQGRFLNDLGLTRSSALSAYLVSGSTYDTDGKEKLPLFKRKMWQVPGTTLDDEVSSE